jgi:hypothetical protein
MASLAYLIVLPRVEVNLGRLVVVDRGRDVIFAPFEQTGRNRLFCLLTVFIGVGIHNFL